MLDECGEKIHIFFTFVLLKAHVMLKCIGFVLKCVRLDELNDEMIISIGIKRSNFFLRFKDCIHVYACGKFNRVHSFQQKNK